MKSFSIYLSLTQLGLCFKRQLIGTLGSGLVVIFFIMSKSILAYQS